MACDRSFVNRNRNRSHRSDFSCVYAQNPDTPDFPRGQVLPGPHDIDSSSMDVNVPSITPAPDCRSRSSILYAAHRGGIDAIRSSESAIEPRPPPLHLVRPSVRSAKTNAPNAQKPANPEERNFWEEPGRTPTCTFVTPERSRSGRFRLRRSHGRIPMGAGGRAILNQTRLRTRAHRRHPPRARHSVRTGEHQGQVVELGKSNFGLLGVRVAKSISEQFGSGAS